MKKTIVLFILILLICPAFAFGTEKQAVTTEGYSSEITPETTSYAIQIYTYTIVVVPGTDETPTAVGLFSSDSSGTPIEMLSFYSLGGIMGKAVSQVAQAVSPGPDHGKVVSAFVHEVIRARRIARESEKNEKHLNKLTPGETDTITDEGLDGGHKNPDKPKKDKEAERLEKEERKAERRENKDKDR